MSEEFSPASVYVDLDSLFDMRLVALSRLGLETVQTALAQDYAARITDEWDNVDNVAFKACYAKRDASFLRDAMITPVVELLREFGHKTLMALVNSPFRRQPRIVLNVYPYKLDEAVIELLIVGLRAATKHQLDIEVIDQDLEALTPSYVKQHFVQMIMYAYWEWLEVHATNQNWHQTQCPEVRLIGPRLIKSKAAAKELEGIDAFGAIETHTSLFIKLILYPAHYFSVDLKKLKSRQTQTAA